MIRINYQQRENVSYIGGMAINGFNKKDFFTIIVYDRNLKYLSYVYMRKIRYV